MAAANTAPCQVNISVIPSVSHSHWPIQPRRPITTIR